MKRGVAIILFFLVAMFIAITPAAGQSKEPIKIGGSLGMTGLFAEQCKWIKRGYETWVDDINQKGGLLGRPVKLIIYDDEGIPDKAVTYYERAITVDKVDLLSGGYPATVNALVMPLAEKYKMLYVSMGGHMPSFKQGYTYSFGSPPLMADWADIALAGILDDLIPKKNWPNSVALLTMNNVVGLAIRNSLRNECKKRDIPVVVDETYNLPLTDATPLVSKARRKNAELLCPLSFFDDDVMITKAARAMNYNPKLMFHALAPALPAWMKELGEDGNVAITFHWWNNRLKYPGCDHINAEAKKRYGMPEAPTYYGFGYCWMKTLEVAVEGTKSLDNTKLRNYLHEGTFDFPYGTGIKFDERGLPPPYAIVTQTTEGRNEVIWPVSQASTKLIYPKPKWKGN
jgi:branched-chain amino acid transport system substrate-binding protein